MRKPAKAVGADGLKGCLDFSVEGLKDTQRSTILSHPPPVADCALIPADEGEKLLRGQGA
jgi:hypothetical protein